MCALEFQQSQTQAQSLVLAPQLRNSLKILQAPAVDLRTASLEELQANPLLEELSIDSISVEERISDPNLSDQEAEKELDFNAEDYSILERMSEDVREQFAQENTPSIVTNEAVERREHFMNSLTVGVSLQQHLIEQADLADCTDEQREALTYLIGSLNESGFLTETLSNVALTSRVAYSAVQSAATLLK